MYEKFEGLSAPYTALPLSPILDYKREVILVENEKKNEKDKTKRKMYKVK